MKITARVLFIICLPVLLLTLSIGVVANNLGPWLAEYGYERYDVSQALARSGLELTGPELEQVYHGLAGYFNSGEEYIDLEVVDDGVPVDLFTAEEVVHFKDVKGLIWLDYWLFLGTLVYILAYVAVNLFWRRNMRRLARGLVWGGGLGIALILVLVLLDALLGFGELWYRFHLVFFSNIYWSAQGYMLKLFPQRFFFDAAVFCVLVVVAVSLILGGVGWWQLRKGRHSESP